MKVALLTAKPHDLLLPFLKQYQDELKRQGIDCGLILIDQNRLKQNNFWLNALKVAQRQAKVARCWVLTSFLRIIFFKLFTQLIKFQNQPTQTDSIPSSAQVMASFNSKACIEKIKQYQPDLICLMGSRIISKQTLAQINTPFINIHSSDPRFMRGSPGVVYEILAGHKTIGLTIHEVTAELDAGRILNQEFVAIQFASTLGTTIERTWNFARPTVLKLFYQTILAFKNQTLKPVEFNKGKLRVTPSIGQTLKAGIICLKKSKF